MDRNQWIIKILEDALDKAKNGTLYFESLDTRVVGLQIGEHSQEPSVLEVTLKYYEAVKYESRT